MNHSLQLLVLVFTLFFTIVNAESGQSISIVDLKPYVKDEKILIDCEVQYRVDQRVREALSNGIEMTFLLEVELREKQDIVFDSIVSKYSHEFSIKYHALSKQYMMLEKDSNAERSFSDLYSAFYYQRNLHKAELGDAKLQDLHTNLYIKARAKLVSEKLPLPLRIKSYIYKDWRPSSGWTTWPI